MTLGRSIGRSIGATLALAFGATMLAVFALVGTYVYTALERQVSTQDDLDIVLAARHTRRLAGELDSLDAVRTHADRLTSQVLGNAALSIAVVDGQGNVLARHNVERTGFEDSPEPAAAASTPASTPASPAPPALPDAELFPPHAPPVPVNERITTDRIATWTAGGGVSVRGVVSDAQLRDHSTIRIAIARNMSDRAAMLDGYRDRLKIAGGLGALFAMLLSYWLIRTSLAPLREIVANTGRITVDKLDTRLDASRAPRELTALVDAQNAMLGRLQQAFGHLSQFSADLAHDLRTPLNNMRGATEVALARPRSPDEYQALLESNLEEYDRLARMIENVLFLARAEHPGFVTRQRAFDVHDELERIAGYFEGLADEAGSTLRVDGHGQLTADLELFRRAVSNLLANALRYTPAGGVIAMSVDETADAVRVVVANPGEPIDSALLPRIFERFVRGDPARSGGVPGGTAGLGLAIVRSVMELHGGTARVESDAAGTRFILTFVTTPTA
ncbi:heavy metal sensor histidine kinase [Burkholderia cepacia]|uniref:heavy metal sensor histidine kinase n=1 Tax=Burkholderia cepacia TaxID=292 RepID=UPI001C934AC6|nr:heavy metal sensor histidine kinase [Burkholderia cepacia]MBY4709547.1 heavy metal sensor histidine kinase [Burkholderia cepacia]MBY4736529.1 heavy metal sensor histidine kinase [Burkholderia cepacia]MBY4744990.1 heavy metal sensor histidine kinase [Burkholderia cepacia]MBY4756122.1 heavy metal sensor histidine kinase [Burkholderia cepacia]MBY4776481.1 heavy metal sensor histidine kinase [Burkholderia cepacia]